MMVRVILLIVAFCTWGSMAWAQQNVLIQNDDFILEYVHRLRLRGHLRALNPKAFPLTYRDVHHALFLESESELDEASRYLLRKAKDQLKRVQGFEIEGEEQVRYGIPGRLGTRFSTSARPDPLRPNGDPALYPFFMIRGFAEHNNWIAQGGATLDLFYDQDPDGLDMARRLYGRSEHFYIGYNTPFFKAYWGRFHTHWGDYRQASALISDNSLPFDKLYLEIGSNKLKLRSIVGELDNLGADGTFYMRDRFEPGNIRRYAVLHRLDWMPTRNVMISYMEAVLYSGQNAGLSLQYLHPLQPLVMQSDSEPKNYENNLMIGGMIWMQFGTWTLSGTLMLDDIVIENRSMLRQLSQLEPPSMSLNGQLHKARLTSHWDIGIHFNMVSALTHKTDQLEGQWTFAQRGIANNFSDFFHVYLFGDWLAYSLADGLTLRPGVHWLVQGQGDIRQPLAIQNPDGSQLPFILTGIVAETIRPELRAIWNPYSRIALDVNIGANVSRNAWNIPGRNIVLFSGLVNCTVLF